MCSFFFSSRRRHTRLQGDWSSDVCSSDLAATAPFAGALSDVIGRKRVIVTAMLLLLIPATMTALAPTLQQLIFWRFVHGLLRSEERRVGNDSRSPPAPAQRQPTRTAQRQT